MSQYFCQTIFNPKLDSLTAQLNILQVTHCNLTIDNLLLQVQLLEEEIVGRRSFWRRQRKRESELTTQENKVAKMLMEDEHVTIHVLREYLDGIYESKFAKTF